MKSETKVKILEAANKLFSKHGFDGASIREIAKEAGVNLGAVNYHFGSKENLYLELIMEIRSYVDLEMEELLDSKSFTLKEFVFALYKKFLEYGDAVNNSFKLMLNDTISPEAFTRYNFKKDFAPPGLTTLLKVISQELGDEIPFMGKVWIGKTIFTLITHMVLMQNSSIGKYHMTELSEDDFNQHVSDFCSMMVESNVEYVLRNPGKFEGFGSCE